MDKPHKYSKLTIEVNRIDKVVVSDCDPSDFENFLEYCYNHGTSLVDNLAVD